MPLQAITSTEPIPGYRIRERIGAGGYGEVWTADAPGGLVKAIKFVYGFLNEDRAARELKALNRIKSVRHPFLLSLERIEIVDGQLLIVTELAEASLKERFDACRAGGLVGIPRDELTRYMRDAADVLDYMNEEHSLQHLDIKPENLLMLAGRVKVADFGLVKDIHDATASLMGGLTPLYAPPEVFDGRPSRRSDQYSLAIVYQEMLTGELPFPGTTAMQLARQHLHARPRLSALPEHDQEAIARALSKSPEDRFANCRELVDALQRGAEEEAARAVESRGTGRRRNGVNGTIPREPGGRKKYQTELLTGVSEMGEALADLHESPVPRVRSDPPVTVLPPIELDDSPPVARPTLFLGVGRSAGRILLQLRRRFEDRFGSLTAVPAIQMLLFDTDTKDLLEVTHHRHGLRAAEVLSLPLRPPQDYRGESRELLRWLSRRWLYNIPKSLRTEGLRPLGRLALVDHADEVFQRIRGAIEAATDDEGRDTSTSTTGLEFASNAMRVVLLASISGGTGSGMIVDLGYLVRHLLARMGLPDDDVRAVLTHSTGRSSRETELAVVNAYSTLTELNHYGRLGGSYPGEAMFQLPPRRDDNLAFRDIYLVDLGEGLNEQQLDDAADKVATYLYLDAATGAGTFFQACRDAQPRHADTRNAELRLRTFGLHQFSCLQDDIVAITVEHLCRHEVDRWLMGTAVELARPALKSSTATVSHGGDRTDGADYSHLRVVAERFADSFRLDVDSLIQEVFRHVERHLGGPADELFQKRIEQLPIKQARETTGETATLIEQFVAEIDALLGPRHPQPDATRSEPGTLVAALAPLLQRSALKRADAIREWLLDMVDDETCRIRGAQWLTQWLASLCKSTQDRLDELREGVEGELAETEQRLSALPAARARARGRSSGDDLHALLEQYCRHRIYEHVITGVSRILKTAKGQVSSVRDELIDFERELRHLGSHFDTTRSFDSLVGDETSVSDNLLESVGHVLVENVDDLTGRLRQRLQGEVLKEAGGLRKLLDQGGDSRNQLPAMLRSIARSTVVGVMRSLDVAEILFHDQAESETSAFTQSLAAAQPRLVRCGGARRLLVMLPKSSTHVRPLQILHEQFGETPSVSRNNDGDFVLCYEVEGISLTQAAVTIINGRRDFVEFAGRLHTRNDVHWSPLPDVDPDDD